MTRGRDRIWVRGICAQACHGVLPHEKVTPAPFVVDVELEVDLSRAGASDALDDTVSYAEVADTVYRILTGPSVELLEHLADRIARAILAAALIEAVTVTVHKPKAPLEVPFDDVEVSIRRSQERRVVVALGGNVGNSAEEIVDRLGDAATELATLPTTRLLALSEVVGSDALPTPGEPQPPYLNAIAILTSDLHPTTLLAELHRIEANFGRVRGRTWAPRTLDLDLISVRNADGREWMTSTGPVLLPHPRARQRAFVMYPWAQVDPLGAPGLAAADGLRPGPQWPATVRRWVRQLGVADQPGAHLHAAPGETVDIGADVPVDVGAARDAGMGSGPAAGVGPDPGAGSGS